MKARILAASLSAGALLATGLLAAPPASAVAAAPSCVGAACNGKNPANTTCQNDARTVAESSDPMGAMELRYSPSCRAAWGRFKINAPSGARIEIKNSQGKKYTTNGRGTFYSVMINDKDVKAWACGIWPSEFGGTNTACTGDY
ncbi:DUF2690 domain-containing protein [Streptomyces sp. NPDC093514]|uniref:DUF2690 domain-containing protein n=1 Tax=Streptomyces sp. NPDC093514 TaxID=3366039 RepID=UPI003815FB2F